MSEDTNNSQGFYSSGSGTSYGSENKVTVKEALIFTALFITTFVTTTIAGAQWVGAYNASGGIEVTDLVKGLPYSVSILLMLTFHEFGHYFASLYHKVRVTLPYYIPFPSIEFFLNFGTMGAFIKTKSPIMNRKALFDIGIAGPLAGFVISLLLIIYGFSTLPGKEYIMMIHPDFDSPEYGMNSLSLIFGDSVLFSFLRSVFANPPDGFIPPMSEIYHYPYICAGWFGLFVTSLNLIPVGQLDGGHIIYSMFGEKKQTAIASIFMIIMFIWGALGLVNSFYYLGSPFIGWSGWLLWAFILYFFIKIKHPPVYYEEPVSKGRMLLGLTGMVIFILSISPTPFVITMKV
ncbi:MAG: site-2 protease family protein [Ignavibacteriaceae bacterium]|nr:site-2 protease family protein [Ignavibacteriaceae bacterium]